MSEQGTAPNASEPVTQERCLCREVIDSFREQFQVPDQVQEHFKNSRIEFLKGIRAIIDSRIEKLSSASPRGAKIAVE
jgi:hypothetical protein